eukprot:scaffold46886_cov28-Tisochrysis_lutea.AAC.5
MGTAETPPPMLVPVLVAPLRRAETAAGAGGAPGEARGGLASPMLERLEMAEPKEERAAATERRREGSP